MTVDDRKISTEEAATLLGVSARTVRRWVENGRLPGISDGRTVTVTEADVTAAAKIRVSESATIRKPRRDQLMRIEDHHSDLNQLIQALTNTQRDLATTAQQLGEATAARDALSQRILDAEGRLAAAETRAREAEQRLIDLATDRLTHQPVVTDTPRRRWWQRQR